MRRRPRLRNLHFWLGPALALSASALLCGSGAARADSSFFGEGRISTGVTGHSDPEGEEEALLDDVHAFTLISPGVAYERSTPRSAHTARYALSTRLGLMGGGTNTLSNRADWGSLFSLSPEGDLALGASAHQGHTSAYDLALPRVVEPLPGEGIHFLRTDADQVYRHRLSPAWSFAQRARGALYYPMSGDFEVAHSYEAGGGLDLERRFRHESVTISVDGAYVSIARPELPDDAGAETNWPQTDRHIVTSARAAGSRALGRFFTAELAAGAAGVAHVESPSSPIVRPSARAALHYEVAGGGAELSYQYDIDTRLNVGETSALHLAQLSGAAPVRAAEGVWLAGTAGYRRGSILDARNRESIGETRAFVLDGQIAWEFRRGFTTSVQLQTYRHDDRREPHHAAPEQRNRSQLMFTLATRFPPEGGAEAPPPGVRTDARAAPEAAAPAEESGGSDAGE